jgi:hypothetical protein
VRPYLKKTHHRNGLVEWLKVKALRRREGGTEGGRGKRRKEGKKGHLHKLQIVYNCSSTPLKLGNSSR